MTEEYLVCKAGFRLLGIRCAIVDVILTVQNDGTSSPISVEYKNKKIPVLNFLFSVKEALPKKDEHYAIIIGNLNRRFAIIAEQIVGQTPISDENILEGFEYCICSETRTFARLRRKESPRLVLLENIR